MSLRERLQLEYEILDRIDQSRRDESPEGVSEELERAIIERELADLEKLSHVDEALVRRKRRAA